MVKLRWTTDKPTQPGKYWAQPILESLPHEIVNVTETVGRGVVLMFGSNIIFPLDMFTHWLGPIPDTEPPYDRQPDKVIQTQERKID